MTITTFDTMYPPGHAMYIMNIYPNQNSRQVKAIKKKIAQMNSESNMKYADRYTYSVTK